MHDDFRDDKNMDWFESWLDRWGDQLQVAEYDTGGWEHMFEVEGSKDAIQSIPKQYISGSDWANHTPNPWGNKNHDSETPETPNG